MLMGPLVASSRSDFEPLLSDRAITAVFQPIVHLHSGEVVGYEALARGPAGSPLSSPKALFAEAYRTGRAAELDWACRAAAIKQALEANLSDRTPLFINVEPGSMGSPCPSDLRPIVDAAHGRLRIVLEVTERSIATNPSGLLAAAGWFRQLSMGLALDDVGADPTSLAMMPLLRPDVIKLDRSLIQDWPAPASVRTLHAVLAQAEHTGAAILAEGVETRRHAEMAQSLGATLGQGWYYGRPGPLLPRPARTHPQLNLLRAPAGQVRTPFEAATAHRFNRATEELLLPMSMHLERQGLDATEPAVLLVCLPDARRFATAIGRPLLASAGMFTAVFGTDLPALPGPDVRGVRLHPDDPLASQWTVIVIGAHFAGALLAQRNNENHHDSASRYRSADTYDYVVSYDRDVVIAAARPLLDRLLPG
jgi:EAL domain-containing protein (putative c-di-GMP-specific phosphodiesterase class I)